MARVGEEFPLECPNCGGDIRLIAFITEPGPIRKILTHLGEPLEPPTLAAARGPPTDWGEDENTKHAAHEPLISRGAPCGRPIGRAIHHTPARLLSSRWHGPVQRLVVSP